MAPHVETAALRTAISVLSRLLHNADSSATVEIAVAEHQRLLACERDAKWRATLPLHTCPRSRIDRDPELAEFIAARAGRMLLREIVDDCRQTFGADRTPSLSTVHRFLQRILQH